MNYEIIKYSAINPNKLKDVFSILSLNYLENESKISDEQIKDFLPAYPNISQWYDRVIKEINENPEHREMFIVLSNEDNLLSISGLMILKNHLSEKKICTLRVKDGYQGKGIGTKLLEYAFQYLNTRTPLITVPQESVAIFSRIFNKYGFIQTECRPNLYREGRDEYIYNGHFE